MKFLVVLLFACGGDEVRIAAAVQLQEGLVLADIGSVDVFVLSGDGLSCDTLAPDWLATRDDVSIRYHALISPNTSRLSGLPPGKGLVFAVDAYASSDGSGQRIGFGCTTATLSAGAVTGIDITLN